MYHKVKQHLLLIQNIKFHHHLKP